MKQSDKAAPSANRADGAASGGTLFEMDQTEPLDGYHSGLYCGGVYGMAVGDYTPAAV